MCPSVPFWARPGFVLSTETPSEARRRKLGESDGRLRMAVYVRGLLRILRLAVLRARRGSRCRGSVGLRPLFLTLLAAFRVRSHICLLLVNPPLDAGACLAQIYPVHNLPNTPDPRPYPRCW